MTTVSKVEKSITRYSPWLCRGA